MLSRIVFTLFTFSLSLSLYGSVQSAGIEKLPRNDLDKEGKRLPSLIWGFRQKKIMTAAHDYFVLAKNDVGRQKTIRQMLHSGVLQDLVPHGMFYLKNGHPLVYRVSKTLELYPAISIEEHLQKAARDKEYTDSKALENLIARLKRISETSDFCFVNLTADKVGIFENRCYLIDLDCVIMASDFKRFKNRKKWKYLKELYTYNQLEQRSEGKL